MSYEDDKPMWNDPAESSRLRQLLRVGRKASNDPAYYDVERGLTRHLANIQSGAPLPEWALGMKFAQAGGGASLTWLMVPLLAAASFGGVWFASGYLTEPSPRVAQRVEAARASAPAGRDGARALDALDTIASETQVAPRAEPTVIAAADTVQPIADAHLGSSRARTEDGRDNSVTRESGAMGRRSRAHANSDDARRAHGDDARWAAHLPSARAVSYAPSAVESPSVSRESARSGSDGESSAAARPSAAAVAQRDPQPTEPNAVPHEAARSLGAADAREPAAAATAVREPERPAASAAETRQPERVIRSDDSRLEREMQMLAVAQRVLLDDPARSLRLVRQGEREFAGSMFSAERKQIGLLALVQLGRLDEARKQGRPFLAAYPNAPWSERLRQALTSGRIPR